MTTFNKLRTLPASNTRDMRAYMGAILEITGLMSGEGFPLECFMSNFATHLKPKTTFPYPTLRKEDDGTYYLTEEGFQYFQRRLTSDPVTAGQAVSRAEIIEMMRHILSLEPDTDWTSFDVNI